MHSGETHKRFFNTPVRKCIDNGSIAFKLVVRNIQGGYQ